MPPLAGFFAKFYVFLAAVQAGSDPLAVIGVARQRHRRLSTTCASSRSCIFDEPAPAFDARHGHRLDRASSLASGAFTLLFMLSAPSPLINAADAAARVAVPVTTLWPHGYRLIRFDELDSTNSEARRLAEAGEPGPLWIIAREQTAGRGRRGRIWDSQPGNLAATLLLRPRRRAAVARSLSFAAALAVADMVAHFAPQPRSRVKWPNDVLLDGRKLAGILLEAAARRTLAGGRHRHQSRARSRRHRISRHRHWRNLGMRRRRRTMHWRCSPRASPTGMMSGMSEGFRALRARLAGARRRAGEPIRARLPDSEIDRRVRRPRCTTARCCSNEHGRAITRHRAGEVFF